MARCEALRSTRCVEVKVAKHQRSSPVRAYPIGMLRAFKAIFFGLLFFWASKRKVTRPSAEGRNARCVSGQVAVTRQPSEKSLDPCLRRGDGSFEVTRQECPPHPNPLPGGEREKGRRASASNYITGF